MKENVLIWDQSNIIPLAIRPSIFENPIIEIEKLASTKLIPTPPIMSGRYMYGRYCVKSPKRLARHKSANSGFLRGDWYIVFFINVIPDVTNHLLVSLKSALDSTSTTPFSVLCTEFIFEVVLEIKYIQLNILVEVHL